MDRLLTGGGRLTLAGQTLAAELYDPAVGTLIGWLRDGTIEEHARCGKVSQYVVSAAQADWELCQDIALETFTTALPPFMKYLDDGKFDPDGPATVRTFFIGACRNRLPQVVERRFGNVSAEVSWEREELLSWVEAEVAPRGADMEWVLRLLTQAPRDLAAVLILMAKDDLSLATACAKLGKNPATMRSQLHRYRRKLAARAFDGSISIPTSTALGAWVSKHTDDTLLAPNKSPVLADACPAGVAE